MSSRAKRTDRPVRAAAIAAAFVIGALAVVSATTTPAHSQDDAAAEAATAQAAALDALRARTVYAPAEFEMNVAAPIALDGGLVVESLKYPSPVESIDSERNDVVKARLFRLEEGATPAAVIAIGGWKFDPLTPELAKEIARTGIQALWIEVPFQGSRTPRGKRPGDLTLSSDLDQTQATFVQLAQDVGRAIDWLAAERGVDRERIGLLGTSLGGFAVGTLFGMHDEYKAVVPQLAGSDVTSVLFNGNWLTRNIEQGLREQGIDEETARKTLSGMSPGTWADPERKDAVLVVAAEKDEIVPLATSRELVELYGGARLLVIPDAPHRAAQGLRDSLPDVRAHFVDRLLTDEERAAWENPTTPSGSDE